MPRRKSVEAAEPAPADVKAEPKKKTARQAAAPKSATSNAAHKHRKDVETLSETPTTVPVALPAASPAREEIARLAYLYWEARGCHGGSPEQDWLRAEQELSELSKNR